MRQVVFELDGSGQPRLTFIRDNGERVLTQVYPKDVLYGERLAIKSMKWLQYGDLPSGEVTENA